jgi:alpha-tubulin suppressor-like RCC1 family protein
MIPITTFLTCANTAITNLTTACSAQTFLQLSSVSKDTANSYVYSVADIASLPDATCNKGRLVYVQDRCSYRFSDGTEWTNDVASTASNFQAWSWGYNFRGRLGDGTITSKSSPVSVLGGFTDWCRVNAGKGGHSLGIRQNGTAWAWGYNLNGQLGDGSGGPLNSKSSPVSVLGGFTDWCQVSGGAVHSLGVRQNGTLWAWGAGTRGQRGSNTDTDVYSPVIVVGGFTDWREASAGFEHSLGLRTNGTIWAWGSNSSGQLGDETTVSKSSPVSVVGGFTDWCGVSAGSNHSLGIRTNGTIWSWGSNNQGQLGDDTFVSNSSPVSVVGGFTDWCQVSGGDAHSIGLRTNGTVWTWGGNSSFQLGNGIFAQNSPVSVVGGITNWCGVSAGGSHNLAVRTDATVWAWGGNNRGQLGDGTTVSKSSPVSVVGNLSGWNRISAGLSHSIAIRVGKGF